MQGARTAVGRRRAVGFAAAGLLVLASGCARDKLAQEGRVTQGQADDYLRRAIRQSSEGVVLDPSQQGLEQIERTRLAEIAQDLRGPAALCFLGRAIETMEQGEVDGEAAWVDVPEGQVKFRARVSVDGNVLATDLLESGFTDDYMNTCLSEVITKQRFVESRDSFAYFIDIYYWVSLGFFAEAHTEQFAEHMRRQQAEAARRALPCLQGRARPGTYTISGLNLFDRDGRTVVNRLDRGVLPDDVSNCVAGTFKQIRIHEESEAFIRPAAPKAEFTVAADGSVSFADQRWLERIELEERAIREQRKAELLGEDEPDGFIDLGEPDDLPITLPHSEPKPVPDPEPMPVPEPPASTPPIKQPTGDPSKPGTKLDLSPGRRR